MDHLPADPQTFLPLTPAVFQILLSLTDGERHGYALQQEVTRASQGTVRLGPGNLYRTLHALVIQGIVEESDERPDPAFDDARRRYYHLTPLGQAVAVAETHRLMRLVALAKAKPQLRPALEGDL